MQNYGFLSANMYRNYEVLYGYGEKERENALLFNEIED